MRRDRPLDPRTGLAVARVAPRRVRRALDRRGLPGWDAPLGPVRVDDALVTLRTPRLTDAAAWRAERLALRAELEPWWPVRRSWDADHDGLAWTGWCTAARAAARRGLAHPFVLLVDGELRGQVGVDAVDLGTSTGELSFWVDTAAVPRGTAAVALALVALRALQSPVAVRRLVAPVAVTNPRPGRTLARLGFTPEVTLREYRATSAGRTDHVVHTLHAGPGTLEHLRSVVHEASRTAAVGLGAPPPSTAQRGRAAALRGRL
ncbi:GNAT family N-acetyltransferase, partial [Rhodococcus aerolatus]